MLREEARRGSLTLQNKSMKAKVQGQANEESLGHKSPLPHRNRPMLAHLLIVMESTARKCVHGMKILMDSENNSWSLS